MMSKGKPELLYEGYTLPKLTIKDLLARNARKDSELRSFHKKLDKEKEELESDFSKTRSQLLSRAHSLLLEGQTYDLGEDSSSSGEEERAFENNGINDSTSSWETSLFSALSNLSNPQVCEEARASEENPRHKQQWAEKVAHFEQSLATKTEGVSALKQSPRRKISWGGRTNPSMDNWDARSEISKASSEGNIAGATGSLGDASRTRVRRHTITRSRSFNPKSSGLTKEALQNHSSSSTKLTGKQRRHTVCTRGNYELRRLTPTEEEERSSPKKPLSDLLPPIKLPPIYLQESKAKEAVKKRDKNFVNTKSKIGVSKSLDAKDLTEDLQYCRYLRVKRMGNTDCPW